MNCRNLKLLKKSAITQKQNTRENNDGTFNLAKTKIVQKNNTCKIIVQKKSI